MPTRPAGNGGPTFGGSWMPSDSRQCCGTSSVIFGGKPNVFDLILLPWVCLFIILMLFLAAAGATNVWVWLPFVLLFGGAVGFFWINYRRGKSLEATLGGLCMAACFIALLVGIAGHHAFLQEWRHIADGASYFNVQPSESAAGKLDATSIVFAEGSKVDTLRTYGYADGEGGSGKTFCVAPISNGDPISEVRIEYWVVGTDCCSQRGLFDCDDSNANGVRAAIVYGQGKHATEGFQKAIEAATHAYGVEAAEDYLMVRWVSSPENWRSNLMNQAVALFFAFVGVHLMLSCFLGCVIDRNLKQK